MLCMSKVATIDEKKNESTCKVVALLTTFYFLE